MNGLLTGGGAGLLNSVFAAIYPDGTLWKEKRVELDGGDFANVPDPKPIKVQTDRVTEAMRSAPGWADAEVRLIILSAGVPALNTDDEISAPDPASGVMTRWRLRTAGRDTCGSHWECAGVRA